jgi:hypothetical protein
VTAFLSLEYKALTQPKMIQTLINHLETEDLVRKK